MAAAAWIATLLFSAGLCAGDETVLLQNQDEQMMARSMSDDELDWQMDLEGDEDFKTVLPTGIKPMQMLKLGPVAYGSLPWLSNSLESVLRELQNLDVESMRLANVFDAESAKATTPAEFETSFLSLVSGVQKSYNVFKNTILSRVRDSGNIIRWAKRLQPALPLTDERDAEASITKTLDNTYLAYALDGAVNASKLFSSEPDTARLIMLNQHGNIQAQELAAQNAEQVKSAKKMERGLNMAVGLLRGAKGEADKKGLKDLFKRLMFFNDKVMGVSVRTHLLVNSALHKNTEKMGLDWQHASNLPAAGSSGRAEAHVAPVLRSSAATEAAVPPATAAPVRAAPARAGARDAKGPTSIRAQIQQQLHHHR